MSRAERANETEGEGKRLVQQRIQIQAPKPWEKETVHKDTQELFDLLSKWFKKLQDGTHVHAQPNPFEAMSQERAAALVFTLDQCMRQHGAWLLKENKTQIVYEDHPCFGRLCPKAQLAMCQEVERLFQYQDEHPDEYYETVEIASDSPARQRVSLDTPFYDRAGWVYPETDGL